ETTQPQADSPCPAPTAAHGARVSQGTAAGRCRGGLAIRALRPRPGRAHDPAAGGARLLPVEQRSGEREMKPSDELEQLLKNLHLNRILDIYGEQSSAAEKEDVTYSEFLTRLLRAQWHHRQETALAWRIKRANLPENWSLASFPFARQPGV